MGIGALSNQPVRGRNRAVLWLVAHQVSKMWLRIRACSNEIAERCFACPKFCVGYSTAEEFVSQPHSVRVDDVSFAIVGNFLDLPVDKIPVDLTAIDATWLSRQTQDPAYLVQ